MEVRRIVLARAGIQEDEGLILRIARKKGLRRKKGTVDSEDSVYYYLRSRIVVGKTSR